MSLLYRDNNGNETHIAGLNGVSGELVPSVSLYQSGTIEIPGQASHSSQTLSVTFATPMPDANYQVIFKNRYGSADVLNVEWQTANGFSFFVYNASEDNTGTHGLDYTAFKLMTDEATQLDEAQIELNKQGITAINAKIPSNASSSNKLVAKSDTVIKHNYSMAGTASLEDDIKTFVTALIALGANTYAGFFNRSGVLGTAGNYSITIYAEEGTSTFASGYIVLGAGATGKAQYNVSYYKPAGSSEEWTIKRLVTEDENNFKYQTLAPDTDLNTITVNGVYTTTISVDSVSSSHAPKAGWNQLIVMRMNNDPHFPTQICLNGDGQTYTRVCQNDAWTAWKQIDNDLTSGTVTIPAQTLENGANAEIQIPLTPNDFYCGRIDFGGLPLANLSLSYNDFSGTFQDTRSTENRSQYVLYPIGKANLATLHVYLTNYTGSPVTISAVPVTYYLEHHKAQ